MITRGIIIGKIVDDFATLKYQIDMRNKLSQFDLTKYCEDFFREVLNITYGYNLKNLNKIRNNNPGLDLGDEKKAVAFQITSQNDKTKIERTYEVITSPQKKAYKRKSVLIIGERKPKYNFTKAFLTKHKFTIEDDIYDINSLLKEIITLDLTQLEILYTLFVKEFRQVKIELEPVDKNGNFESSYYNALEKKPSSPPKNASKFIDPQEEGYDKEFKKLKELYDNLASTPRVTREILAIIVERGKYEPTYQIPNKYGIIPEALQKFLRLDKNEFMTEINILEDAKLVEFDEGDLGERSVIYLVVRGHTLNDLLYHLQEQGVSIRTMLNTMDFTELDN